MTAVVVTAGEWLRAPSLGAAAAAVLTAVGAGIALWPPGGWRHRLGSVVFTGLAVAVALTQRRVTLIETRWPDQLEMRIRAASGRLSGDLHGAFRLAEQLAAAGAVAASGSQAAAFRSLASRVPSSGAESGVAILDPGGAPWAWAGRQRLAPLASGDSLAARSTGYYLVLETRRHSANGRIVVASVLIWAHAAVADRSRSLAELFRARTEVGLEVYAPGAAPNTANVFDYTEPTTAGDRLLFSTQPVPPSQSEARTLAQADGARIVAWLLLLGIGLAFAVVQHATLRFGLLPLVVWLAIRAPIGPALGVRSPFSAATFFLPLLGPLTSSSAALALGGALLVVAGAALLRVNSRAGWLGLVGAAFCSVVAPLFIALVGPGITPPTDGVSMPLWLTWQLTLFLPSAGLVLLAVAGLRRGGSASAPVWPAALGCALAIAAGIGGLWGWQPASGLPAGYPLLWLPVVLLILLPAPRWVALAAIATGIGSLAAVITWSTAVAGRLDVADHDLSRLGTAADPFAVPLLESFATDLGRTPSLSRQAAMYALWRQSPLWGQRYPARLTLWNAAGAPTAELPLDMLGVPDSALAPLVRSLPVTVARRVTAFSGTPGMHYVLVARVDSASILTVVIGPRSALVAPSRLGRLLHPIVRSAPLYRLALAPPDAVPARIPEGGHWRRDGWTARAERLLELPGGARQVRGVVDLRGPVPLLVRGALVLAADFAVLSLLALVADLAAVGVTRRLRWRQFGRSFRLRLTGALAVFFIVPTLAFAAWTVTHFREEAQTGRDLLITESLRDPALSEAALTLPRGLALDSALTALSDRVNADLALYRGGTFNAASAPILPELGVIGPLMEPGAYRSLALDGELEVTRDGAIPTLAERVGYRVVRPGPPDQLGVVATPQVADIESVGTPTKQADLALVLLLATLAGACAAVLSAGVAGRALSRPVSDLRRSALALGRGDPMPGDIASPPFEFEPVFGAFRRMAADISLSRAALEEARRRTATVLATVATGVVGLDTDGRVLIANRQAIDLLGTPLDEGAAFAASLDARWGELVRVLATFLRDPIHAASGTELTAGGRRIALQLAPLGPEVSGVVLALNDVTDLSRAERVLAWGEMARQVAHEIKNPLTPVRLGIQHLQRAHRDGRPDFDRTLEETAQRILVEIDRLDTIARAFSRFAAPSAEQQALERLDLAAVAMEVVQLYRLAGEGAEVALDAPEHTWAAARRDEVKEVLVNLLENARNAGARAITIRVRSGRLVVLDDGAGIPPEQMARIFEPRFSTTTSGSGLGLPIVRRLVEGWGGEVSVTSEPGQGTTVTVTLLP